MGNKWIWLPLFVLLLSPSPGAAEVVNGDFEGADGWALTGPDGWSLDILPADGYPGGYARVQSTNENSAGAGCVSQTFECGIAGQSLCDITVDFEHANGAADPQAGRVQIFIDGNLAYTSPAIDKHAWSTVALSTTCGVHTLTLCLEVDEGNNGWLARFDNVTSRCNAPTPVEQGTWGWIKTIYR